MSGSEIRYIHLLVLFGWLSDCLILLIVWSSWLSDPPGCLIPAILLCNVSWYRTARAQSHLYKVLKWSRLRVSKHLANTIYRVSYTLTFPNPGSLEANPIYHSPGKHLHRLAVNSKERAEAFSAHRNLLTVENKNPIHTFLLAHPSNLPAEWWKDGRRGMEWFMHRAKSYPNFLKTRSTASMPAYG